MSLDSGRAVEGSVDGGEKMSSGAGVLGGRESRTMSAVGMGSIMSICGGGGGTFRVMVSFARLVLGKGFFSGLSVTAERCFFGERTGSVLTGSRLVSQKYIATKFDTYCCPGQAVQGTVAGVVRWSLCYQMGRAYSFD